MSRASGPLAHNSSDIQRRVKRVAELRAQGFTGREIASELGCSLSVIQKLIARASDQRVSFQDSEWTDGLPHRTARALLGLGYASREEVMQGVECGRLTEDAPGFSMRAMQVLRRWLGLGATADRMPGR